MQCPCGLTFPMPGETLRIMQVRFLHLILFSFLLPLSLPAAFHIGAAAVDITPDYNVRLSGFGFRRAESEGVHQRIWVKALAVDDQKNGPAVLVTVDNLGVPNSMVRSVALRLQKKKGLKPERLTITATHTHTAPMLTNVAPTLFSLPIPKEHQVHIDRYTRDLEKWIEEAVLGALKDLQPGSLEWGVGSVGFAINRRGNRGPQPVDHDLPLLVARTTAGKIRAIHVSYACHCVTLRNNRIGGDWAGYAQAAMQQNHPEAIAMVSIGCGADQNPKEMIRAAAGDLDFGIPLKQGREIATEVNRLLGLGLNPISAPLNTRQAKLLLPFDKHPTRPEWETLAKRAGAVGYHAQVQLARLDRKEKLQESIHYPVQTWAFGDQLAMVFLPGEVVVDYSVRLKEEFDRTRLFVHSYANGSPCYIPSERILKEGGYEGGGAMIYYDRPTRLAAGIEAKIIDEVHRQLPKEFRARKGCEGTAPRSPEASRLCIAVPPGLRVELAAAEPMVFDPVAMDWGIDGQLWVVEMHDYPTGLDGKWQAGGRVVRLADRDGDGRMDSRRVFLDQIPFPTGLMTWRDGVLVCAAPDLLFARDTTGDGRADKVTRLLTGFNRSNFQARVNGLHWGLDNWIHAANGLLGGTIDGSSTGNVFDIRGHDFRFRVAGPVIERLSGLSQQGRVRDDWGNAFGCTNGNLCWHYPLPERYARRNSHVKLPGPRVGMVDGSYARLYPRSRLLKRFNHPESANRVTSACGIGVYRDELLGREYADDLFTCEPVHNLVVHLDLKPRGATYTASRVRDRREFLASTDNWFRPSQVRTGPDGALWVADMYRFLIEHPRWVAHDRLAKIDVRAGAKHGRIYRIVPEGKPKRPVADLTALSVEKVASLLESRNGPTRDLAHRQLVLLGKKRAANPVLRRFRESSRPRTRLQALCVLDGLESVTPQLLHRALGDSHPAVRSRAVVLSEPLLDSDAQILESVQALVADKEERVRFQLALSLGNSSSAAATQTLATLASRNNDDQWMRAAILSSATTRAEELLSRLQSERGSLIEPLIATMMGASSKTEAMKRVLMIHPLKETKLDLDYLRRLAILDEGLRRHRQSLVSLKTARDKSLRAHFIVLQKHFKQAAGLVADPKTEQSKRLAAINLMGRGFLEPTFTRGVLVKLLDEGPVIRQAALERLLGQGAPEMAGILLGRWGRYGPQLRKDILNALTSRPQWTDEMLKQVEAGAVSQSEFTLTQRDQLRKHPRDDLSRRALNLFKPPPARRKILEKYAGLEGQKGDAAKGAVLFRQTCAICHQFRGQGQAMGPRLDAFYTKPAADYLKAILDPNSVVEPGFVQYQVGLQDGRELAGIVQAESSTNLTLAQPNGIRHMLLKKDVKQLKVMELSMMPEGLEQALPPDKMSDLLAYLRSPQ